LKLLLNIPEGGINIEAPYIQNIPEDNCERDTEEMTQIIEPM